jgi:hypothetical protein
MRVQNSQLSGGWKRRPPPQGGRNENEIACPSLAGRKLRVCRDTFFLRSRRWSGLSLLCCAASTTSARDRVCACTGSRLHLDWGLLVSGRSTLAVARRILGSAAIRRRLLDRSALLRRPLLCGLLAPVSFGHQFNSSARLDWAALFVEQPAATLTLHCRVY